MSTIFVFNPTEFKLAYPSFEKYTDEQLNFMFDMVENDILDNTVSTCIPLKTRKKFFYLLVAHMAELQSRIDDGNSGLVGRISSASEGSVSISSDYLSSPTALAQWLNQTPYGATYYAMSARYRVALWVSAEKPMPVNRSRWHFFLR